MINIRQSPPYAQYMQDIGWIVEKAGKWNIFVRKFPLIGSFIKVQKIKPPIPFAEIDLLREKYRAFRVKIEPDLKQSSQFPAGNVLRSIAGRSVLNSEFNKWRYVADKEPYLPTKTIQIDLTKSEKQLFRSLTESKQRSVRKARKNGVVIQESTKIEQFIKLKTSLLFPFNFFIRRDICALWQNFSPEQGKLLLAYLNDQVLAGIFLLFCDNVSYYWLAGSTSLGKRLAAPTLLVWEALKLSQKMKCRRFDFEGIFDERFPKVTASWQGFTKFKQGFGGKTVYYSHPFVTNSSLLPGFAD